MTVISDITLDTHVTYLCKFKYRLESKMLVIASIIVHYSIKFLSSKD
jgi:hypothetical protein